MLSNSQQLPLQPPPPLRMGMTMETSTSTQSNSEYPFDPLQLSSKESSVFSLEEQNESLKTQLFNALAELHSLKQQQQSQHHHQQHHEQSQLQSNNNHHHQHDHSHQNHHQSSHLHRSQTTPLISTTSPHGSDSTFESQQEIIVVVPINPEIEMISSQQSSLSMLSSITTQSPFSEESDDHSVIVPPAQDKFKSQESEDMKKQKYQLMFRQLPQQEQITTNPFQIQNGIESADSTKPQQPPESLPPLLPTRSQRLTNIRKSTFELQKSSADNASQAQIPETPKLKTQTSFSMFDQISDSPRTASELPMTPMNQQYMRNMESFISQNQGGGSCSNRNSTSIRDSNNNPQLEFPTPTVTVDPALAAFEQRSEPFRSLFAQINEFGQLGDLLFEDFLIIGPDFEQLGVYDQQQQQSQLQRSSVNCGQQQQQQREHIRSKATPKILFKAPSPVQNRNALQEERINAVPSFVFPHGTVTYHEFRPTEDISTLPSRYKETLLMNLCQQKEIGITENTFVLNQVKEFRRNVSPYLLAMNPNAQMYVFNYSTMDVLVKTCPVTQKHTVFYFPVVYSILSYYPFLSFFFRIILEILSQIKATRLIRSGFSGIIDNQLKDADFSAVLANLNVDYPLMLALQELQMKDIIHGRLIQFAVSCSITEERVLPSTASVSFRVPSLENFASFEAREAAFFPLRNLAYEDFLVILTLILLEQKVCLFSASASLVTLSMMTLSNLFKPFVYSHPIIYSLPEDIMDSLDSPMGIFIGINMPAKTLLPKVQNYNCFFVDLDANVIHTRDQNQLQKILKNLFRFGNYSTQIFHAFNSMNAGLASKQFKNIIKNTNKYKRTTNKKQLFDVQPEQHEKNQVAIVLKSISDAVKELIIDRIPESPIFLAGSSNDQLNIPAIATAILRNNIEEPFLRQFVETQMFMDYLSNYYY